MRRESYLSQPQPVEVYDVKAGTDVILRKNIEQIEKEDIQDGKVAMYTCWECDETQYRHRGNISLNKVAEKFDYFWNLADGMTDQEATDEVAIIAGEPTLLERLETLEGAFMELVEVIVNG